MAQRTFYNLHFYPAGTTPYGMNYMVDLQETFDQLSKLPMFESERPATLEELQELEAELGVTLPSQYKELLLRSSYLGWFGGEILGLRPTDGMTGNKSNVTSDCVSETKRANHPSNPFGTSHLPCEHLVISTDGGGGYYVLFRDDGCYGGQVHYYNLKDSVNALQIWGTLQEFLEEQIRAAG